MPSPTPTQPIFVDFSSQGLAEQVFVSLQISTATGGTAGTYIPTQYYNSIGTEGSTGFFINIPQGFGLTAKLTWINGATGLSFVEGSYLYIQQNGITVANASYTGNYAGSLQVILPTAITGANYQIVSFLSGTGPTAIYWNTLAEPWNTSTVIWNG